MNESSGFVVCTESRLLMEELSSSLNLMEEKQKHNILFSKN